jgi:hypothetical protein
MTPSVFLNVSKLKEPQMPQIRLIFTDLRVDTFTDFTDLYIDCQHLNRRKSV